MLDRKYEIAKANPNAQAEKAESKTGFSKRNQQAALLDRTLVQQTLVDQMIDADLKQQAQSSMQKQQRLLDQAESIDQEIAKRRNQKREEDEQLLLIT